MRNKIVLSGLFLTTAISCSAYRPVVLQAFLNPESTTEVTYEQLNFSYALFNQFASGLSYELRLDYSAYNNLLVNQSIQLNGVAGFNYFTLWDTITSTYAEATLNQAWTNAFNSILFDRLFNRTTKKSETTKELVLIRQNGVGVLNFEIKIKSKISYKVNIGSAYMAFLSFVSGGIENFYNYIYFYNSNNVLLQTYLLTQDRTSANRNYVYNLSEVITDVKSFTLNFQWVDILPYDTGGALIAIREFNLFTQNQEIDIPDDASGNRFGFEFVAVEWWNILGHLQNFIWWIVNQSPVAPVFEFIDEYIVTWISGLIDLIKGVFNI